MFVRSFVDGSKTPILVVRLGVQGGVQCPPQTGARRCKWVRTRRPVSRRRINFRFRKAQEGFRGSCEDNALPLS